jgi:large subunit ribosomal protein L17
MRHRKTTKKFSRSRAQRKALIKALSRAILLSERIKTTEMKAKAMRTWTDRLITWAKTDSLHNRRLAYQALGDHALVKRLFTQIGPRFKDLTGGYTRVIKLGNRKGDNASMAILELTRVQHKIRMKKAKASVDEEQAPREEKAPEKSEKQKKRFMSGMKSIFKKEKDSHAR